jgi:hypothetical protein
VAVYAFLGGLVDLAPVADAEQPLGAAVLPDQRAEQREQCVTGLVAGARHRGQVRARTSARDADPSSAFLDELGTARIGVGGPEPEVVAWLAGRIDAARGWRDRAAARGWSACGDAGARRSTKVMNPLEAPAAGRGGDPAAPKSHSVRAGRGRPTCDTTRLRGGERKSHARCFVADCCAALRGAA